MWWRFPVHFPGASCFEALDEPTPTAVGISLPPKKIRSNVVYLRDGNGGPVKPRRVGYSAVKKAPPLPAQSRTSSRQKLPSLPIEKPFPAMIFHPFSSRNYAPPRITGISRQKSASPVVNCHPFPPRKYCPRMTSSNYSSVRFFFRRARTWLIPSGHYRKFFGCLARFPRSYSQKQKNHTL